MCPAIDIAGGRDDLCGMSRPRQNQVAIAEGAGTNIAPLRTSHREIPNRLLGNEQVWVFATFILTLKWKGALRAFASARGI
jgi:hypothetical protein